MSSAATSAQKAQIYGLLKFIVPFSTLMAATAVYILMRDEGIFTYVAGGLVLLAVGEFFALQDMAAKAERQAQRDRG